MLALGTTAVWLGCTDGSLIRLDPTSMAATARRKIGTAAETLAVQGDRLWMQTHSVDATGTRINAQALRLDPSNLAVVSSLPSPDSAIGPIAIGADGKPWVTADDTTDAAIALFPMIPHPTALLIRVDAPADPEQLAVANGELWVLNGGPYELFRVTL